MLGTPNAKRTPRAGETLNIMQASRVHKVSRRIIYVWLEKNQIEWIRVASGGIRIFKDSLEKRVRRMRGRRAVSNIL